MVRPFLRYLTPVVLVVFVGCRSLDNTADGIWHESGTPSTFIILKPGGTYCLAKNDKVVLEDDYAIDDNGTVHLKGLAATVLGDYTSITLSPDRTILIVKKVPDRRVLFIKYGPMPTR